MEYFERLCDRVEQAWRSRAFDRDAFPEVATQALDEDSPCQHVKFSDIAHWFHRSGEKVPQTNLEGSFGEPPVTVARREAFYIEALHWLDGTTSIHQHGFSGAFHVLEGSSIHANYGFNVRETISHRLILGDLRLKKLELLKQGDTRAIHHGQTLTHALFHLDRPSVTVVVRTYSELRPSSGPQYEYYTAGIAADPFGVPTILNRKLSVLHQLHRMDRNAYEQALNAYVREADAESLFYLAQLGVEFEEPDQAAILEKVISAGGPIATVIGPLMTEEARKSNIILRRGDIKNPDHRFLLALLLNVPSVEGLLQLVQGRYPGRSAAALITQWLGELSRVRVADATQRNAIGLATTDSDDLDDTALAVIEGWLERATPEQICTRVAARTGDRLDAENVGEFLEELSTAPLLVPLFTRAT